MTEMAQGLAFYPRYRCCIAIYVPVLLRRLGFPCNLCRDGRQVKDICSRRLTRGRGDNDSKMAERYAAHGMFDTYMTRCQFVCLSIRKDCLCDGVGRWN